MLTDLPSETAADINDALRALSDASGMSTVMVTRVLGDSWLVWAAVDGGDYGFQSGEMRMDPRTLCRVVLESARSLVVPDVESSSFAGHLEGYPMGSYIGAPLVQPDGHVIGLLCAIDRRPHPELGSMRGLFEALGRIFVHEPLLASRVRASQDALLRETENALARERFLAAVAHDLRTPLASIRATASSILHQHEVGRILDGAQRIVRASDRAERLIRDVLDLARGRIGLGIPIAKKPIADVRAYLESIVQEVAAAFPGARVCTSFDVASGTDVRWDGDRIAQCVGNLLSNACTYRVPGTEVVVQAHEYEDSIAVVVRNAGELPEHCGKFGAEPLQSDGRRRVGLGLFIANRIARAHGGTLVLGSGGGFTAAELVLPRSLQPTSRRTPVQVES